MPAGGKSRVELPSWCTSHSSLVLGKPEPNCPSRLGTPLRIALGILLKNYGIRNIQIHISERIAYGTSTKHIDAVNSNGNTLNMWWQDTTCFLLKRNGTWHLTHAHCSVPFNPNTRQPSLNPGKSIKKDRLLAFPSASKSKQRNVKRSIRENLLRG